MAILSTSPVVVHNVQINEEVDIEHPVTPKYNKYCKYLKQSIFLALWLFLALFLIISKPYIPESYFVPLQQNKSYKVRVEEVVKRKAICLRLIGPVDARPRLTTEFQPRIYVTVSTVDVATKKTVYKSREWILYVTGGRIQTNKENFRVKISGKQILDDPEDHGEQHKIGQTIYVNLYAQKAVILTLNINTSPVGKLTGIIVNCALMLFLNVLLFLDIMDGARAGLLVTTTAVGIGAMLGARPLLSNLVESFNVEIFVLCIGMMMSVTIISETGVLDYVVLFAFQLSRGNHWMVLCIVCLVSGILSTLINKVMIVLLMGPVVIRLCEVLSLNTNVLLISITIFANIGGTMTLSGTPVTMMVRREPELTDRFSVGIMTVSLLPGVLFAMATGFGILCLLVRKKLFMASETTASVEELQRQAERLQNVERTLSRALSKRILVLRNVELSRQNSMTDLTYEDALQRLKANAEITSLAQVIACGISFGFALSMSIMAASLAGDRSSVIWTQLVAMLLLLILARKQNLFMMADAVEWSAMILIACIFMLCEILKSFDSIDIVIDICFKTIMRVSKTHQLVVSLTLIIWTSALSSLMAGDTDMATKMISMTIRLSRVFDLPMRPLIWSLLYGLGFGRNESMISCTVNVVVVGLARQYGYRITPLNFFLLSFPIMLCNLVTITIYLVLVYN